MNIPHRNFGNKSKHPLYSRYRNIKTRCNNPNGTNYKYYGGRGINCEWKTFEEFCNDMYKSYIKHSKKFFGDTSIDRIDVNGNYCKKNCRWATQSEQIFNRRPFVKHI